MIIIVSVKKKHTRLPSPALTALWMLIIFLLFYFLKSPALAAESVRGALELCAMGLIPSLFPFIVLVSMFNSSGMSARFANIIGRPLGRLFGIDRSAASAILLGALGGFPIGAVCTRELYDSGALTSTDAERLLTFTNNASPAFCIGAVGLSLFGDIGFGVQLYICQLSAALLIGIVQRRRVTPSGVKPRCAANISVSDTVTSAIAGGGATMLKICAFAVFFAVVGDALCSVISRFFGDTSAALSAALCELTLAGRRCAALGGNIPRLICTFAVGWSGMSVHMQTASILSGSGLSMKRYYLCKLLQGLIGTALMLMTIYCPQANI